MPCSGFYSTAIVSKENINRLCYNFSISPYNNRYALIAVNTHINTHQHKIKYNIAIKSDAIMPFTATQIKVDHV